MSIPKLSVSNPVLSNLLMVVITALGVYAWVTLPRDLIPEIVTYTARISTFYPGASAETVEKLVTARIEDAIEKVDQITSYYVEAVRTNFSTFQVIFNFRRFVE